MSKRYPGNSITGNPVALSQTSNNGIWDLNENYAAVTNGTWQAAGSGIYEIPRSLRFRNSAATYLTKVAGTPTSQNVWTISMWVKLGNMMASNGTASAAFFGANQAGNPNESIKWDGPAQGGASRIYYQSATSGGTHNISRFISYNFRDPSAWYHLVFQKSGSAASGLSCFSAWINGVAVLNYEGGYTGTQASVPNYINTTGSTFNIGAIGSANSLDCYMAEVNFVDGQALDASYFGYTDSVNGIWQPKKYTGVYGNNGFYLPFSENFSTTNLGRNFTGSNHFTYSQAGTDASYVYNNASGTANFTTAPDGTFTATKLTIDSSNTTHRFYKQYTVLTSGAVAVVSAYVKALPGSAYNVVALENWTGSAGGQAYFNLTTGQPQYAAAWPAGSGYQHVGDGWYRIWTTFANSTSNGSGSPSIGIYMVDNSNSLTYTGNGTAGFYFWGVQVNLGTTPDNYIATTSAASINNFTLTNFSVAAGATNDSIVDSPTNIFTTVADIGGVVSGNYNVMNPIGGKAGTATITNGNLTISGTVNNRPFIGSTLYARTGKYYFEFTTTTVGDVGDSHAIGFVRSDWSPATGVLYGNTSGYHRSLSGNFAGSLQINDGLGVSSNPIGTGGGFWTDGVTYALAVDFDANIIYIYRSGTLVYTWSVPSFAGYEWGVYFEPESSSSRTPAANWHFNFGQRAFTYGPPPGFKTLNTTNLQALGSTTVGSAAIKSNKWFDTVLYGGTGAARTITNPGGFVPDLVWTKVRNTTYGHNWSDSARGAGVRLSSGDALGENANVNGGVTSFNTTNNNGYNIGGGVEDNENGRPYVSWQWKQSPTSGFNIIPYTGTGVARSISHNLGVAPRMMIIKRRDTTANWIVYHSSITTSQDNFLYLNSPASTVNAGVVFNSTNPTSSVFTVGTDATTNAISGTYIAYLFAEVPGFSKFGSFVGNGVADGTFVYTGFRPKFILTKASSNSTGSTIWAIFDTTRNPNNASKIELYAGANTAEGTDSDGIDILSNGFKPKRNSEYVNFSGWTYIYAAFAESPFALNNRAR